MAKTTRILLGILPYLLNLSAYKRANNNVHDHSGI